MMIMQNKGVVNFRDKYGLDYVIIITNKITNSCIVRNTPYLSKHLFSKDNF